MSAAPGSAPQRRPRPVADALLLVLAVVLAHAWLLERWAGSAALPAGSMAAARATPGAAAPAVPRGVPRLQRRWVETLLLPPAALPARRVAGVDAAVPSAATVPAVPRVQPPRRVQQVPAPAVSGPADSAPSEPTAAPLTTVAPAPPAEPVTGRAAAPAADVDTSASTPAAGAATMAGPAQADAGPAPPVYPTRLPPPVWLHYAMNYNGQPGDAQLAWQHDGQRYRLRLSAQAAGRPVVEQTSSGGFDAAGLAPERFVDRRHGRSARAASFDRDSGRIIFSGPAVEYPAWPGAQDRLAWVAQLAAIAGALEPTTAGGAIALAPDRSGMTPPPRPSSAAPKPAGAAQPWPDELRVFVVDARGAGEVWTFALQGSQTIQTPLGPLHALHLLRAPPRADALRVEAWLDPARSFWPARLRLTAPRSGDVFELLLAAEPGTPP